MFTNNFEGDYDAIVKRLRENRPFALSRFGDGEWALLQKRRYKSADDWVTKGDTPIHGALLESLQANMPGYCVGYSPPCCHPKCVGFYADNMRAPPDHRTFATVFFHGNYPRAKAFFEKLDAFTIGCTQGSDVRVNADLVNSPFDSDSILQRMLAVRDRPILVAAGPAACILVCRYWRWTKKNPETRVPCIDVGALLDVAKHGKKTRYYHDKSTGLHKHYCRWDNWESARQRTVVAVHNSVKGRFVRDVAAPNKMKSPLQQVAERRQAGKKPKWVTNRPKGKSK